MAANLDPIYSKAGDIQSGGGAVIGPNANTAQDGTGANITSVFQADTTNGGFIQRLRFRSAGSPAATVARVYVCSVTGAFTPGTSNTAANTWLIDEIALPAVTVSQTLASNPFDVPLNFALPAGYRLLVSFGTSTGSAGTGWVVTGIGGAY
jgi:hypothetical protein